MKSSTVLSIIPQPKSIRLAHGTFILSADAAISWRGTEETEDIALLLAEYLRPATGYAFPVRPEQDGSTAAIAIVQTSDPKPDADGFYPEAYSLHIDATGVRLSAESAAGLARGIQTIRQLLPVGIFSSSVQPGVAWQMPCADIEDEPRFRWRGLHLDVSRHFFGVDDVCRYIELLAQHRNSVFHWHLTDDQGWRIEIRKYPKLTQIGSKRKETLIGHDNADNLRYDGIPYGGFYTQDDIRKVVAFAKRRHILVVPELDMPGHMSAAIAAYPELGNGLEKPEVRCRWGIADQVLNMEDSTVQFCKDVWSEIFELFPGRFCHIGGDEAPRGEWAKSPRAQELKHKRGLQTDSDLQSWFTRQMGEFFRANGKYLIGWDEILEGENIPADAVAMIWHDEKPEENVVKVLSRGNKIVLAPSSRAYFDHYPTGHKSAEPLCIGGKTTVDDVYSYCPEKVVPRESIGNVLGGQGQLWTEYIPSRERLEYMAYPRACALAEVLWSPTYLRDLDDFHSRLAKHLSRLAVEGVRYHHTPLPREEKIDATRTMAASGMVLLKNDDNVLPIRPKSKIALLGITSYHCHRMGAGSGDMPAQKIREYNVGLAAAGLDFSGPLDDYYKTEIRNNDFYRHVNKNGWRNWSFRLPEPENPDLDRMIADVRGRVAVVTLGRNAGEAEDLTVSDPHKSFKLVDEEEQLLGKICANFGAVVVLLNVCGVIDTSFLDRYPNIKAVLLTGLAGETSGDAVADVITGKTCPAGRLAMTWAKRYEDYPTTTGFGMREVPYNEGIYVGYRFFDTFDVEPRFPFGFGLSYTDFTETSEDVSVCGAMVSLRVSVKNIGGVAGAQVVQCYLSSPAGKLDKPFQALCCFGKTKVLLPGDSEVLSLTFDLRTMASYDETCASEILERGDYLLRLGVSSRDTHIVGVLQLAETVVVRKLHTIATCTLDLLNGFNAPGITRMAMQDQSELASAKVLRLDPEAMHADRAVVKPAVDGLQANRVWSSLTQEQYGKGGLLEQGVLTLQDVVEGNCSALDVVKQFTSDELARCVIGFPSDQCSSKGNNSGAGQMQGITDGEAGELWRSETYGIPPSNCADGPSGVRLAGMERDEEISDLAIIPVAYPCCTLVAQTWDIDLAEHFGDYVSDDLAAVGVDGWLAPGVNIQRNPLCGRNFEYLSEDPLLSGQLGGFIVRGVQLLKDASGKETPSGRYATMKHFTTNNQETERKCENNIVSERALREIYLKPFWWCNEIGHPLAVMTAYNKLNGEFCATNKNLLTTVLRDEWNYDGMVMTDWWNQADQLRHCLAGNDVQMDGWQDVHEGLATKLIDAICMGTMDIASAQISASRVLELIARTSLCITRRLQPMSGRATRTVDCLIVGVHTGKTICAENSGNDPLVANRDQCGGSWELFTLIKNADGSFSFRSVANGKYVSARPLPDGRLIAEGPRVDAWEKFDLEEIPGKSGTFAIRSRNTERYVSVDETAGNVLVANRERVDAWEEFRVFFR